MSAPLAPAIADALAQRLDAFRGAAEASGDTGDDEAAHRVRVTARRLHAALLLWRPLLALPAAARPGVLRRVEQRFGARRDLDVLRARVEALRTTERPLADVIATLRARTDDAEERGRLVLRRRSTRRMIAALTEWIATPAWTPLATLSPPHLLPWLIAPTASRVLVHPGWAVAGIPEPDDPDGRPLHRLRRRLKALRYRLECLSGWYGAPIEAWLAELHAMQDALGAWHDEGVMLRMLVHAGLEPALGAVARTRAAAAMAPWPAWRERYLDAGVRSRCWALLGPPSAAV
ncbi:MAG: CHAD domain-containing protein [Gemmatimonadetes bacterium]|nr:CHAD domain-containing protein [Gemmatimonadota bacterium]